MKKPSRKTLVKKLDTIFSQVVRKREPYCVTCGARDNLTCGHLFSRSHYITRWDLDNAHTQCWGCNYKHEYDWEPFRSWYVNAFGEEQYKKLYEKHGTIKKFTNTELEELYQHYKEMYER